MELRETGWIILNYHVVSKLYPNKVFGLYLPLQVEGESEAVTEDCHFLVKERTKTEIIGVVDLGNSQLRQIVLTPIKNDEIGFDQMLTYELSEIPEEVTDDRDIGKD